MIIIVPALLSKMCANKDMSNPLAAGSSEIKSATSHMIAGFPVWFFPSVM